MPDKDTPDHNDPIVIFDGVCNFCNSVVNFIIKRDPHGAIYFSPMQSDYAQQLMAYYQIDNLALNTFVLIKDREVFIRSTAALEICKNLTGFWRLMWVFKIIPKPVRDGVYRLIARNRYRWFGKMDSCIVPNDKLRARFIF